MNYKFRLTAHTRTRGLFHLNEPSISVELPGVGELTLAPRDADTLDQATKYHFDCGGFPNADVAGECGEKLRQSLRFLTAILDLTLVVPSEDRETGQVHDDIKKPIRDEGGDLLNTRTGLSVYPDDGKHLEFVASGEGIVRTSDPSFILNTVRDFWPIDIHIDDASLRAIEILSLSAAEASDTTKFLLTYLAIEQLIPRNDLGKDAIELLESLRELVNASVLTDDEKTPMLSFLSNLGQESFRTAFKKYVARIEQPADVNGIPLSDLVSRSVDLRNRVAHHITEAYTTEIQTVTRALRQFAISAIWTSNRLPPITIDRPADTIRINKMEVRIL
jgi:hypothetical protein